MKRIFTLSAAALIALTGAASAMTSANSLNSAAIHGYAPSADVSAMTDAQIGTIMAVIYGGDSDSEKHRLVNALVRTAG